MKSRHNLTIDNEIWNALRLIADVQKRGSVSAVIEGLVKSYIASNKITPIYFKIMASTDFCDDKENREIIESLDSLKEDDLHIESEIEFEV
ncbi:hypothetical protein KAH37_09950 [bacterium]|nr:hypothetical protein [bacterium]